MAATDTSGAAQRRTRAVFVDMSGASRLLYAMTMADDVRDIGLAGIRSRHPDWDPTRVAEEWIRLLHGDSVAKTVTSCSSNS